MIWHVCSSYGGYGIRANYFSRVILYFSNVLFKNIAIYKPNSTRKIKIKVKLDFLYRKSRLFKKKAVNSNLLKERSNLICISDVVCK